MQQQGGTAFASLRVMSATTTATNDLADKKDEVQEKAAPWVERLARAGYLGKGVVYVLIGALAASAAFGFGGEVGGSKNALQTLAGDNIFSTILLWLIGVGLAGYALWNFFRAILDPENEGNDGKALAKRALFAISGVIHVGLAFYVFSTLLAGDGGGSGGGDGGTQSMVGKVLDWGTIGRILIAAVGLGIAGFGIGQLVKAYKADLSDQLDLSPLDASKRSAVVAISRTGLAARGVVFIIVGWFFLQAAYYGNSGEAGGTQKAMEFFGQVSWLVLGAVAIGLACYGLYMIVKSRYRRINANA